MLFVVNVSWFFISHRLGLARYAAERGYEVHVATRVESETDALLIRDAGLVLHDVQIGRADASMFSDVRALMALSRLFYETKPDIVHLVTMKPVVFGGIAAILARVPAVVIAIAGLGHVFTASGRRATLRRGLLVQLLRLAAMHRNAIVVCQNRDDLELLVHERVVSRERTRLVRGAGVDLEVYRPASEAPPPLKVLLASRMLRTKGIPEFVECAREIRSRRTNVEFLLAGLPDPGNPASLSEAELRRWHEEGVVTWLGHVADMPALLDSVHMVVLPTYYGEGIPKVLIEAAAAGRPIVTTDMPGCRDIVVHDLNGFLVRPRDVHGLVAAVERLLDSAALRARLGDCGRERARQGFGTGEVYGQTITVYAELMADQPRRPA